MRLLTASLALLIFSLAFGFRLNAATLAKTETITSSEFQSRRRQVMAQIPSGIVLLHANSGWKHWEDSGFRQDANFFYLTGLENLQRAILAIDGFTRQSWLFVSV